LASANGTLVKGLGALAQIASWYSAKAGIAHYLNPLAEANGHEKYL
jgi:hypothetical protein